MKPRPRQIFALTAGALLLWILIGFVVYMCFPDWTTRGQFGDMFGALNSLFSCLTLFGVVYSLYLQVKTAEADHARRRKQATIEHLNTIRPIYKSLLAQAEKAIGPDVLTTEALKQILDDPELRNTVKDYLSTIEHFCVGLNTGVFDKDLVYRMSANYFIRMFDKFKPYISHAQKNLPTAYVEYQTLVHEFERRRQQPSSVGNLVD